MQPKYLYHEENRGNIVASGVINSQISIVNATKREKAQSSGDPPAVQDWRRSSAILTKEITDAKRSAFDRYISNLNYKTEAKKIYKFTNNLCSNVTKLKKEPLILRNKTLCDDDQTANAFAKHFSAKQRK